VLHFTKHAAIRGVCAIFSIWLWGFAPNNAAFLGNCWHCIVRLLFVVPALYLNKNFYMPICGFCSSDAFYHPLSHSVCCHSFIHSGTHSLTHSLTHRLTAKVTQVVIKIIATMRRLLGQENDEEGAKAAGWHRKRSGNAGCLCSTHANKLRLLTYLLQKGHSFTQASFDNLKYLWVPANSTQRRWWQAKKRLKQKPNQKKYCMH